MALHTANVTVTPVSPPAPLPPKHIFVSVSGKHVCKQSLAVWQMKLFLTTERHQQSSYMKAPNPASYVHLKNKSEKPNSPGWSYSTLGTVLDESVSH